VGRRLGRRNLPCLPRLPETQHECPELGPSPAPRQAGWYVSKVPAPDKVGSWFRLGKAGFIRSTLRIEFLQTRRNFGRYSLLA
jgi:hypothetical protein